MELKSKWEKLMDRTATMPAMPGLAIEARAEMVPGALMEAQAEREGAMQGTILAHDMAAGRAGAGAEAVGAVEAPDRGIIQRVADKMAGTKMGRKILGTAVGLAGAGAAFGPAVASASESGHSTTTIVDTTTNVTTHGAHAWQKDGDHSKVTVMGNHRIVSKAKVKQMIANGQCSWHNGKKENIHTEGHATSGNAFGKDERKSLFCRTNEDFNGDGKADWIRARCGNAAIIGVTPENAIEQVLWLGGKGVFGVHAKSEATAQAQCSTEDGHASASAYGHARAGAHGRVRLHGGVKQRVKQAQGEVDSVISQSLSGKAGAKSKAFAIADAQCSESGGNTPPPPSTPPKDGTEGPGAGTPGQPGGPGAGGDPGSTENSYICRDPADAVNGDGNSQTEGANMNDNQAPDQFGYCTSPAAPLS